MPSESDRSSSIQRVEYCLELASRGYRPGRITAGVAERFGVTTRTADEDWARAREMLAWDVQERRDEYRGRVSAFLWRIARTAEGAGEFGAAIAAMRQLCKLFGLEQPSRVEISAMVGMAPPSALTPIQRKQEIARLLESRRKAEAIDIEPAAELGNDPNLDS